LLPHCKETNFFVCYLISTEYIVKTLRVKVDKKDIVEALTGYVTDHHRFMLKTILSNISKIETTLAEIEGQIEKVIEPYKKIIELLETIPGLAYNGAIGKGYPCIRGLITQI